jgi:hypothetical protein
MNFFRTLAIVGLVGVGMVSHCLAQNVYPPFPDELVNKYDIIATAKVSGIAGPLSGSAMMQSHQVGVEVVLSKLLPEKLLKGKLPSEPIVIQTIDSETIILEKDKEYLLFLRQSDWHYQPANIFPIKNGKVTWYKESKTKSLPAPSWELMPIEQAAKAIEGIVKDADTATPSEGSKPAGHERLPNAFHGNGVETEYAPVTEGDVMRKMLKSIDRPSPSPTPQ